MKRAIFLLFTVIGMTFFVQAQNELDALRFSKVYYYGTTRTMGMAGAFSALGADPGSYVINPAALGLARFSDFSLSTGFKMAQTFYDFSGNSDYDLKYNLGINNLAAVFANEKSKGVLKYLNFSFTYNRLLDFNRNMTIKGTNDRGSMIDYFVYMSNGLRPDQLDNFSTGLAYDAYLTDVADSVTWEYIGANTVNDTIYYGETQRKNVQTWGSGGSYDFSLAVNLLDKVFLGGSFSFISMKYYNLSTYSEYDFPDPVELKSFNFNENISDLVSGYALKFGMTVVPVNFLRLSIAAHSPYFLSVKDFYSSSLDSHWKTPDADNNYDYSFQSPYNKFKYNITTPWRVTAGAGFLVGKILAADVEMDYVNYSLMSMSSRDYGFENENSNIRKNFKATKNYRAGAELNLGMLQLRAGVAKYGAAYERFSDYWIYSGGLGLRVSKMYFDLGFNYRTQKEDYRFYVPYYEDEPYPKLTFQNYLISFTIGTKF